MGLLNIFSSNSYTTEYKKRYTIVFNLIINFSFHDLNESEGQAINKINISYLELIEIAKNIRHPHEEYFNIYLLSKVNLSVGESLLMITNAIELAFNGGKITKSILENIISCCRDDAKTENGKLFVRQLLTTEYV